MAKRTRPRYKSGKKKGQFMSDRAIAAQRSGRKRKKTKRNPGRSVARARPRAAPKKKRAPARRSRPAARRRRAPARRNPPRKRMDIMGTLMGGSIEAVQILIGKAAARSVPDLARLPKEGNIGLAVQAAVALASGWVASMFLSANASRAIMAGGLTAPLETLIVAYQVPWLSQALSPVSAANGVGAYARGRISNGMGAYAKARPPLVIEERGLAGYVSSADSGIPAGYDS